jgi:hypothetical protein
MIYRLRHKIDGMRDDSLLHVEARRARVSQSGLKTGEDVTAGGERGIIVEVTSR